MERSTQSGFANRGKACLLSGPQKDGQANGKGGLVKPIPLKLQPHPQLSRQPADELNIFQLAKRNTRNAN
ncbi:hypothetical protein PVC01_080026100 [Plasmodium vivax]|uniref:(malaria parasite P. vivax) hypothetical protein n=1 Tax=Plasmodium vivax TaxID=5855 RepID=A0A1G4HBR3_PLAVI|nr:unnamed protein product [Plasmodium vivax]CAI7720111.1 hypothetical protein PVPAM_080033300 [Plasmodium vivax]SCO66930.1 hypothetical protein PVT01_080026300 [Plasmodium vivax]SCO72357.1 hypothetical protein PVC01_080026100 [Plasmodium vivax]